MWANLLQDNNFCNHVPRMNLQIAVATLAHVSTTMWRIELATYRTPMLRHLLHCTPTFNPVVCVLAIFGLSIFIKKLTATSLQIRFRGSCTNTDSKRN